MSKEIKAPEGAKSKVTVSTGKVIFFREPKILDYEQATRKAKLKDGGIDEILLMKDFAQRLIVGVYRKNGDRIITHDTGRLLREEGVFNYQEVIEITNCVSELLAGIEKKGKYEKL